MIFIQMLDWVHQKTRWLIYQMFLFTMKICVNHVLLAKQISKKYI